MVEEHLILIALTLNTYSFFQDSPPHRLSVVHHSSKLVITELAMDNNTRVNGFSGISSEDSLVITTTDMMFFDDLKEIQIIVAELAQDPERHPSLLRLLREFKESAHHASEPQGNGNDVLYEASTVEDVYKTESSAGRPFIFLGLYPEIRNMVYKECLVVGSVHTVPRSTKHQSALTTSMSATAPSSSRPQMELLLANCQIFDEAAPIFFTDNQSKKSNLLTKNS